MAWNLYALPLIADLAGHRGPKYLGSRAAPIDVTLSGLPKVMTNASAAQPIVITSNGHGLVTGQQVRIDGVIGLEVPAGVSRVNGTWLLTRLGNNSFSLDDSNAIGASAYGGGGTALLTIRWDLVDYGKSPWCLVAADVSVAQHAFLVAQSDVAAIPTAFDDQLGGPAATTARDFLEAASIPGTWITASDTWRSVLRSVIGTFNFANRYLAIANDTLVPSGQTLTTQFGNLTAQQQQAYRDTCADFGIPTDFLTPQITLHNAIKALADLWADTPRTLGGLAL